MKYRQILKLLKKFNEKSNNKQIKYLHNLLDFDDIKHFGLRWFDTHYLTNYDKKIAAKIIKNIGLFDSRLLNRLINDGYIEKSKNKNYTTGYDLKHIEIPSRIEIISNHIIKYWKIYGLIVNIIGWVICFVLK